MYHVYIQTFNTNVNVYHPFGHRIWMYSLNIFSYRLLCLCRFVQYILYCSHVNLLIHVLEFITLLIYLLLKNHKVLFTIITVISCCVNVSCCWVLNLCHFSSCLFSLLWITVLCIQYWRRAIIVHILVYKQSSSLS